MNITRNGKRRPPFPVAIARRTLVSPICVLTGCRIGSGCYLATNVIVLQGANVGDHSRIGAGAIVHANTHVPEGARVGMRHIAVQTPSGFASSADVEVARESVAAADFFELAFETQETDQASLHEQVLKKLLDEVHGWHDEL